MKLILLSLLVSQASLANSLFSHQTECKIDGTVYTFLEDTVTRKELNGDYAVETKMVEIPGSYTPGSSEFSSRSYLFMKSKEFVVIPKLTKKYDGPIQVYHSKYKNILCKVSTFYSIR